MVTVALSFQVKFGMVVTVVSSLAVIASVAFKINKGENKWYSCPEPCKLQNSKSC